MAWYRCMGGSGLPAGLQTDMDAVLNKKFSTSTTYPPSDWPNTVNLMGPLPERTTSASIAHIEDGASEVPLKNWLVTLPASLSGYSEVNGVKSGANLFNEDWEVGGINDTTGLPNSDTNKIRSKTFSIIKGGVTCYVGAPKNIRVLFYASDESFISETANIMNASFSVPANCSLFKIRGTVDYGTTYNNDIMISYGSTPTTWEAYTPITQYTASLGRTIYGGQADIVTGEGSETHKGYTLDNLTWSGGLIDGNWVWYTDLSADGLKLPTNSEIFSGICDNYTPIRYNGVSGTTNTIALRNNGYLYVNNGSSETEPTGKVTIELATSTDFTFTPITPTPETENVCNFWADEGDSSVTYRADIDLLLGGN